MSRVFVFGAVAIVVILVFIHVMILAAKDKGVPDFMESEIVRCPTTGGIYRITNGMKSWYPSEAIWRLRGSLKPRDVDCASLDNLQSGPDIT